MLKPAIFLDRDGVIVENRDDYVRSWADVIFIPEATDTLARISQLGYLIVLVTNQSAVGRGILDLVDAKEINNRLVEEIQKAGGRIDGVYMCPHAPRENCHCRKPEPGLFYQAARDMTIDLGNSIMIGDALSDLAAARSAGVGQVVLVRTGRGRAQEQLPEAIKLQPFSVFDDLAMAMAELFPLPNKNIPINR